jgi:surface carbohydrate biosynthesis protein
VETASRELDGKLLLALFAAEHGLRPIIGGRAAIHHQLHKIPRSIYFAKGARSRSRNVFRQLRALGHVIVAADEEALVRPHDDMFMCKLDPKTMRHVQLLIAWGQDNKEVWLRSSFVDGIPIATDGNPRTDMLRPEFRAYHAAAIAAIRERYAPFILFNTNFFDVNHFIPNKTRFKVADWVPAERKVELKTTRIAHKRALFDSFLRLVPQIAGAIAPVNLVIRPHPSESLQVWEEAARDITNVKVVREEAVVPWLYAAEALLHNGCTTAVEAAVVGTPAINFEPTRSEVFDTELPRALSTCLKRESDLLEMLSAIRTERPPAINDSQKRILEHCLSGLEGRFCCERMLDSITKMSFDSSSTMTARERVSAVSSHHAQRLLQTVREAAVGPSRISSYQSHKFPSIQPETVNARIDRFAQTLGRFAGLRAHELMSDVMEIRSATA